MILTQVRGVARAASAAGIDADVQAALANLYAEQPVAKMLAKKAVAILTPMHSTGISFTAESGSGAQLGPFKTEMAGVGPVLSHISPPICGHTLVAEVKWLPQIDIAKTLKGDNVWFKLALAF